MVEAEPGSGDSFLQRGGTGNWGRGPSQGLCMREIGGWVCVGRPFSRLKQCTFEVMGSLAF